MNAKSLWILALLALPLVACRDHQSGHADEQALDHTSAHAREKASAKAHEHDEAKHDHGHADHGKSGAALTLNSGQKWQTDESLRTGMAAIRNEVQTALGPIHDGKYSPEDYQALGGRIEKHLAAIMATCKLPPDADAQLHLVLAEFYAGAGMMKKGEDQMGGALRTIKALASYAQFFEHPDFQPIQH